MGRGVIAGTQIVGTVVHTRYEATLIYTESLLRQAVFAFWRRMVGVGFFIAITLLVISLAFQLWRGERSWEVGVIGTLIVGALVFVATIYVFHFRNALAKFRAMGQPTATLVLEEASFTLSSGIGSSVLQWSAITKVWRFRGFWLVLFSKSQFVTLPLAALSEEAQAFIVSRVEASGGKIVG